jgi:hypothetical protein
LSPKTTKRGFDKEDYRWFSAKAMEQLQTAQQEIQWLLDRGYKLDSVMGLVGGHHLLSSRQRTALQRATSPTLQYKKRRLAMLPFEAAKDGCLYVDGFNLIITLEVALSGGILILGNDGVLRDLAGLRGTYSIIEQTDIALNFIGKCLGQLSAPKIKFFLDSPVSNSGNLKKMILESSVEWGIPVEVELVPNADTVLFQMERIITGDSILLDSCKSWFNISKKIVDDYIDDAWIVSFTR